MTSALEVEENERTVRDDDREHREHSRVARRLDRQRHEALEQAVRLCEAVRNLLLEDDDENRGDADVDKGAADEPNTAVDIVGNDGEEFSSELAL